MREILFKAKRINNGEWVQGWYMETFTGSALIVTLYDHILGMIEKYEVDPNTISQFTGLKDKNGKMIFENDIVKTDEAGWVAKVIYYTYSFICVDNIGGFSSMCNWGDFEILGNIFDNPELLGE